MYGDKKQKPRADDWWGGVWKGERSACDFDGYAKIQQLVEFFKSALLCCYYCKKCDTLSMGEDRQIF